MTPAAAAPSLRRRLAHVPGVVGVVATGVLTVRIARPDALAAVPLRHEGVRVVASIVRGEAS